MKRLAIVGASGHGKVVAETAELCGWQDIVFYDDSWPRKQENSVWKIAGDFSMLLECLSSFDGVIVAIGHNATRFSMLEQLSKAGVHLPMIIHPTAVVSRSATLSDGLVIFANVVINANASIGAGVILNTACTIDHDCVIGSSVHISPGAHLAGSVQVGDCSWVGIGAIVKQGMIIGTQSVVGAGAVVVSDVPSNVTVVGVPARALIK
ncbi:acetyltransferase [Pseudomonas sp. S9]|uniref:acetyltransferase n=1 Tax=Pseudomonas sp. S9 TaxID=686578 RepID=UPI0002556D38|nr:acetyltransferase [Pseudomonas sp. S9]